nr:protein disulfide oxidoreductase [Parahaliea mediterranea]
MDQWRHRDTPTEAPRQLLPDLDGAHLDIRRMSMETPVLVYFWATWCPVCRLVSPSVNALDEKHPVVAITLTSGPPERIAAYAREHALGFRMVNDANGHVSRAWGVRATPTIAVVYRGEIRSITSGITTLPGIMFRLWLAEHIATPTESDAQTLSTTEQESTL